MHPPSQGTTKSTAGEPQRFIYFLFTGPILLWVTRLSAE